MKGDGEPELPPWARRRRAGEQPARAPRPVWVVVLACLMLIFGARLLFSGLGTLGSMRAGPGPRDAALVSPAVTPEEALVRDLQELSRAFDQAHPTTMTLHAVSKIALAMILFFAVAAVVARDRRGRAAALVAGWAGIVYHVGNAAFLILVVRRGVLDAVPVLARLAQSRREGSAGATSVDELMSFAESFMLVVPAVTAGFGIAFSLVVLAYFGGRRGRAFYGLELEGRAQHGG